MKRMSVQEYAQARGITPQAVTKAIRKGHAVSGVDSYELFGGVYILYVNEHQVVRKKRKKSSKKPA